jgi:DNA-binding FadR family transcriptional regulator
MGVVGNLGTQVAALIAKNIVAGGVSPGATLPTEAELCRAYGVSRTTVREALKKLHGKGLVAGTSRTGTVVLPTDRWNQFDPDLLVWRFELGPDERLLEELYQIRTCVEPEACRIAAQYSTSDDSARIQNAFERMADLRVQPARLIEADLAFHRAIVDATHNRFFITLGTALATALRVTFLLLQHRGEMPQDELALHGTIARAISLRHGEEAAKTMKQLITISQRNLTGGSGIQVKPHALPNELRTASGRRS